MIKLLKVLSKLENVKINELDNNAIPYDIAIKNKTTKLKELLGNS